LVVQTGLLQGSRFPLNQDFVTLGRSANNDITLPDERASRHHARIERRADGLYLIDTQSTNGTYVGGQRIVIQRLQPGDEVRIGDTLIGFCYF